MSTNDDQQIRRFLVRGRVQGVGFRWFVEREASVHLLTGWVRNNDDGSVEVLAAGSAVGLVTLLQSLHRGPRAARVDGVEELPLGDAGDLKSAIADGRRGFWVSA